MDAVPGLPHRGPPPTDQAEGDGDARPRQQGTAAVHRSGLVVRAEVRRVSRDRGAGGGTRDDPLPPRLRGDPRASRSRRCAARAPGRAGSDGRRDRRARRFRPAEFPAAAEARAAHRSRRSGPRRTGAPRDAVLLRSARLRGFRLAVASAGRAQAPLAPHAPRSGPAPVRRSRGGTRRGDVPRRSRAGARRRDGQARRFALPIRPLARVDQDPLGPDRRLRRGRVYGRRGISQRLRGAAPRLCRGVGIRLCGTGRQRLQ